MIDGHIKQKTLPTHIRLISSHSLDKFLGYGTLRQNIFLQMSVGRHTHLRRRGVSSALIGFAPQLRRSVALGAISTTVIIVNAEGQQLPHLQGSHWGSIFAKLTS